MKKFLFSLSFIFASFSFSDNVAIRGGVGIDYYALPTLKAEIEYNKTFSQNIEKSMNFDVAFGGELNFGTIIKLHSLQVIPYLTPKGVFNINNDLSINVGGKFGLGIEGILSDEDYLLLPVSKIALITGVDYKHFTSNIELLSYTIHGLAPLYSGGIKVGYKF